MKVRETCFVVPLAVFVLVYAYLVLHKSGDPIRYVNFEQIEIGMTRQEVAELLGCGPCRYENGVTYTVLCNYRGPDPRGIWEGETKRITITFVADRVDQKHLETKEPQWIGRLKLCIGLGEAE